MKTKLSTKKIRLFILFLALSPAPLALCQVPQGFNYQAIARDGTGNILPNQALPVRISIMSDSIGTIVFWKELHASISSNSFGLITLSVGRGERQTGSTVSTFSAIDWSVTPIFIKTEINYGGWITMGVSRLWSVPYAITAKNVTSPLTITGTTTDMEEALFEVKNKAGNTVFAVYNEGVRAYVGNGNSKGARGGFAVGGYDATKGTIYDLFVLNTDSARFYVDSKPHLKGARGGFSVGGYDMTKTGVPIHDYLDVSKDSVRIYVDSDPTSKGKKGGFSVGGYDMTKGEVPAQDYMHVSKDSVRVYVDSNPSTKGARGGFAVGGYDLTKGTIQKFLAVNPDSTRIFTSDTISGFSVGNVKTGVATSYLRLTPLNYFIGHESGLSTKPGSGFIGKYNSFIGYQAGKGNVTGRGNVYLGYQSGLSTTSSYNVFLGEQTGCNPLNTGGYNTFIGYHSGFSNKGGDSNVFIGFQSGNSNEGGASNVFIGNGTGQANVSSTGNIIIGYQAGKQHKTGDNNIFLGYQAGATKSTGSNNIFIGYRAGFSNTLSDKLYIAHSESFPPLIYGDFSTPYVAINDTLQHSTYTFYVNGPAGGSTAWNTTSDSRLKSNIETITGALDKVMQLRGVNFEWNDQSVEPGRRMGFIAQEAEKIIPEVVNTKGDYFSMQYAPITALLVEAIKEQQKIISAQNTKMDNLEKDNEMLNSKIESLAKELEQLKQIVSNQNK
jgi:trimeric autotransporter adhesin